MVIPIQFPYIGLGARGYLEAGELLDAVHTSSMVLVGWVLDCTGQVP